MTCRLVTRRRAAVEPVPFRHAWQWGMIPPEDRIYPNVELRNADRALYLLHDGIALVSTPDDQPDAAGGDTPVSRRKQR